MRIGGVLNPEFGVSPGIGGISSSEMELRGGWVFKPGNVLGPFTLQAGL